VPTQAEGVAGKAGEDSEIHALSANRRQKSSSAPCSLSEVHVREDTLTSPAKVALRNCSPLRTASTATDKSLVPSDLTT